MPNAQSRDAGDEGARALWEAAAADFGDEKRHTAFITYCARMGLLPFAARKYAERLEAAPDDPIAGRCRQMIVAQASSILGRREKRQGPLEFLSRHRRTIVVAIGLVFIFLLLLLVRRIQEISSVMQGVR